MLIKTETGVNMETMNEYVVRKLKERGVHCTEVSNSTQVSLRTIYNIRDGKDALISNVQKLNDYFKKAAD